MDENPDENSNGTPTKLYPDLPEGTWKKENGKFMGNYCEDMALVIKAADLAARRHRAQRRKDIQQTPYINHPIGNIFLTLSRLLKWHFGSMNKNGIFDGKFFEY